MARVAYEYEEVIVEVIDTAYHFKSIGTYYSVAFKLTESFTRPSVEEHSYVLGYILTGAKYGELAAIRSLRPRLQLVTVNPIELLRKKGT